MFLLIYILRHYLLISYLISFCYSTLDTSHKARTLSIGLVKISVMQDTVAKLRGKAGTGGGGLERSKSLTSSGVICANATIILAARAGWRQIY